MIDLIELIKFTDAQTLTSIPAVQPSGPVIPIVTQPIVRTNRDTADLPTLMMPVYQLPRDTFGRFHLDIVDPIEFVPTLDLIADAVERFRVLTGALPTAILLSGRRWWEMRWLGFRAYHVQVARDAGYVPHVAIPFLHEPEPTYEIRCRG